ncbi:MAG: recombinase RecA, partial [Candidatus Sungbacteria bacterium]|nr:recombinase RecA [Candidatus Sungbacteria bacterium]
IMKLGGVRKVDVDAIPTGSLALDMALGVGGVPRGRVIEIFGPESSGKTTLSLHIVAEAQKKGGLAAFVDAEHALDPDYAKRLGVKVNDLLISQPDTGEQALDITESLVRSGSVDVVVIDSVAALTPQAEIEGEMGQQHIGLQARLMSHALRKLTAAVAHTKTTVIFINQIRMQIGIMFGNPETTPGGKALKFYSSVRIEVRRAAQIKKGEEIVGNRVNAKIVKNKVAAPFRRAEFDIFYNEGISRDAELLTLGEKYGAVKKAGASFTFEGTRLGQGFDNARMFLKQNPKVAEDIGRKIREAVTAPSGE